MKYIRQTISPDIPAKLTDAPALKGREKTKLYLSGGKIVAEFPE